MRKFAMVGVLLLVGANAHALTADNPLAVNADRQSATAIALNMIGEPFNGQRVDRIENEIKAIRALKISGTEKINVYQNLPDMVQIELSGESQQKIIEDIRKTVALEEGYSSFNVKKTGVPELDNILARSPVVGIEESIQVSGDGHEPDILVFEIKLDDDQLEIFDFVAFNRALGQLKTVKNVKFHGDAHYGQITLGTNLPGIERLSDGEGGARYVFWRGVGDCMAGCRGTYYYFSVIRKDSKFVAQQVHKISEKP